MRDRFDALPVPMRVTAIVVFGSIALVLLFLFYDWLGTTFLDTGGTVG